MSVPNVCGEQCPRSPRLTHDLVVSLIRRARGAHGVRLSRTRLAVGEYGNVVALHEAVDTIGDVLEDSILVNVFAKDAVEDEDLAAARGIDGQTGARGDLACGAAEALWDEVVARVALLEGGSHADGCIGLWLEGALTRGRGGFRVQ